MRLALKPFLPRSLYGRAALILIVPIVTIQLIVSIAFIQRHFEGVTKQLSIGVLSEIDLILSRVDAAPDAAAALRNIEELAGVFGMVAALPAPSDLIRDERDWDDLTAGIVMRVLKEAQPRISAVDLSSRSGMVRLALSTAKGPMMLEIDRKRLSASNPHQLLVIMVLASVLMTLIAYVFLRNQLRPIARLAVAAEAFGKGEAVPYRPRGATEVRAAGAAFLDMRNRIERAIETRTRMLSGISHDLRTPLTRMRLGLSMLPDEDEVRGLQSDVAEMERLVEEFLAFVRGDVMEETVLADPKVVAQRIIDNAQRAGRTVGLALYDEDLQIRMRPQAIQRALDNLVGNALRHADRVDLTVIPSERGVRFVVEDDGPGIPDVDREAALQPFTRLDAARDPNHGGGVGLGLSIAADVARSHGGALSLGRSDRLGGLRAELRIAR